MGCSGWTLLFASPSLRFAMSWTLRAWNGPSHFRSLLGSGFLTGDNSHYMLRLVCRLVALLLLASFPPRLAARCEPWRLIRRAHCDRLVVGFSLEITPTSLLALELLDGGRLPIMPRDALRRTLVGLLGLGSALRFALASLGYALDASCLGWAEQPPTPLGSGFLTRDKSHYAW